MAEPLVSVVMPAYKAADTIAHAAASVLAQTHEALELIVVSDDGEDYLALLRETHGLADPRLRQVSTGGVGTGDWNARNHGLAAAKGAFVTLLDADDAYAPDRLAVLTPLAAADGAALDDTQLILDGRTVVTLLHAEERLSGAPAPATAPLALRDRTPVFPMWRRDAFDIRWRKLPHAADVIFFLELLSAAPGMRISPTPGYLYVKRQGSMTLSASMTDRSRAAYLEIIRAVASGDYALAPEIADYALYEFAKNLNQANAFQAALAADPTLTHEVLAMRFNDRPMTEAERVAFFQGVGP